MIRKFINVVNFKTQLRFIYLPTRPKCKNICSYREVLSCQTFRVHFVEARQFSGTKTFFNKLYVDNENRHSREVMANMENYVLIRRVFPDVSLISQEEYATLITSDWSKANPGDLLTCFKQLSEYAKRNNIRISENVFDPFIDAFTDSFERLSDDQLEEVFWYLRMWPETRSAKLRNFIEVWVALDEVCSSRIYDWSFDKKFLFGEYACLLNLGKKLDFMYKLVLNGVRRSKHLDPQEFVQLMYYVGIRRSETIKLFPLQWRFAEVFDELSIDEIAVAGLGFFKSKSPLRDCSLVDRIISRTIEDINKLDSISLTALLKILRYSYAIANHDGVVNLLNSLNSQIDKASLMCCVHIALLCQRSHVYNVDILSKIAEKFKLNPQMARMKDLERFALAYGSINIPSSSLVFELILNELKSPERQGEILQFGRDFACCLLYLISNVTPDASLMSRALDKDFLKITYGKVPYDIGREILGLDNTIEIEFENYTGNRLEEKCASILAKKYTEYAPQVDKNGKLPRNYLKKMYASIALLLEKVRGKDCVRCIHLIPHYAEADIVIGDDQDDRPLSTTGLFKYDYKVQKKPPEGTWFCLIITQRKGVYDKLLNGNHIKSKTKQLSILGYKPVVILWNDWMLLSNDSERIAFINKMIYGTTVDQLNIMDNGISNDNAPLTDQAFSSS